MSLLGGRSPDAGVMGPDPHPCFPPHTQNQRDPMALDKIMKDLDQCRDGKVGFQGFFSLVAGLTIACNDYFVLHMKQKGRK